MTRVKGTGRGVKEVEEIVHGEKEEWSMDEVS